MKPILLWMVIAVIGTGATVWTDSRQQNSMHKASSFMAQIMKGSEAYAAQGTGNAASKYSSLCAACHGPKGKGNGPAAAALNPKPKDFTDCKAMAEFSDETLFKVIKGGGQSAGLAPIMPAWGSSLTDPQIHSMVKYVRSFCKK